MKLPHSLLTTAFILIQFSMICAQDIHLRNGNKIKTIKAGTFISIQTPVADQDPCLKCQLNFLAGQLISYESGKLKLRVLHNDKVIIEEKKDVGLNHRSYKDGTNQPIIEISGESILTITKRGTKKYMTRTTGEKVGMFLVLLGTANILSAPLAEIIDKDGAVPFTFVGLGEIITGGVLGASLSHSTFVTNPDFPQKRNRKKIWVLN